MSLRFISELVCFCAWIFTVIAFVRIYEREMECSRELAEVFSFIRNGMCVGYKGYDECLSECGFTGKSLYEYCRETEIVKGELLSQVYSAESGMGVNPAYKSAADFDALCTGICEFARAYNEDSRAHLICRTVTATAAALIIFILIL